MSPEQLNQDIFDQLAMPFDDVRQRQGRAGMMYQYITSTQVMDRLDQVVGPDNWEDKFTVIDTCVYCVISLTLPGGEVISRGDASGYDLRGDGDKVDRKNSDVKKAAFSDAFKRAAMKFGIGRYLRTNQGQRRPHLHGGSADTRRFQDVDISRPRGSPAAEPKPSEFPSRVPAAGRRPGSALYRKFANKPYGGEWTHYLNKFGCEQSPPYPELVKDWTQEQCDAFEEHIKKWKAEQASAREAAE